MQGGRRSGHHQRHGAGFGPSSARRYRWSPTGGRGGWIAALWGVAVSSVRSPQRGAAEADGVVISRARRR